jgi:hypothetical protein
MALMKLIFVEKKPLSMVDKNLKIIEPILTK